MQRHRLTLVILSIFILLGVSSAGTDRTDEVKRIRAAANVLDEIMATPDKGIPEEIMESAECVAVVPSMLNGGFIFGARYGKGVATCRTESGWSPPVPLQVAGGSWGLQIGGEAVDLVMIIMNKNGMHDLLSSKLKLGADVSAAAGPVGRHAEGTTDWKMRAKVLTYSRARGIFAGISLNGAALTQDEDSTISLYGSRVPFDTILAGKVAAPEGSQVFLEAVKKYATEAKSTEAKVHKGDQQ
jgi:SH3 domain-containing YSC84-like protein 1